MPPRAKVSTPKEVPADTPTPTFPITLSSGLVVQVYEADEAQWAVVYKVANDAQRDKTKMLRAIEVTFRVAEKLLVDPADAQRIEDQMIDKLVSIEDIMKLFTGGVDADEVKAAAPRRVRRAR